MSGLIDFSTQCPWQLYTFALIHMISGVCMYIIDTCRLLTQSSSSCTGSELVMARFAALSCVYVGVIFAALTYHSKTSPAKITRLSNIALNGATALLVSVIFCGNASHGGLETSWMHVGDMLTMIILVGILASRVSQPDAVWANKNALGDGLGVNCKTLLVLFLAAGAMKFIAFTDIINPTELLADGLEMTDFGHWMWNFTAVALLEALLALFYAVFFEDDVGQEFLVFAMLFMYPVAFGSIYSIRDHTSDWMGLNNSTSLLIRMAIIVAVSAVAIIGGRRSGGASRAGYNSVS